jgi:hypothetical protein
MADLRRALEIHTVYNSRRRYLHLYLAGAQILAGDLFGARETLTRALAEAAPSSTGRPIPYLWATLGRVHQRLNQRQSAAEAYRESLRCARAVGTFHPLPLVLDGVAWLAGTSASDPLAAQLLGAGESQDVFANSHNVFDSLRDRQELTLQLRGRLGFHNFFTLYEEGRRLPLESVLALAAAEIERHAPSSSGAPDLGLSPSP